MKRHFEVMGGGGGRHKSWETLLAPATVIIAGGQIDDADVVCRHSTADARAQQIDRTERSGEGQSTHDRFGAFPDN